MEVHAHAHTERKKWTHYFWEFLMLFLAVFCGFLAENQREHYIEHQRAKVYASNLYDELKKDTARLNYLTTQYDFIKGKLDTFCLLSKERLQRKITNGMLYYYASFATSVVYFSPHNATIEQLKGSGNLRLMGAKAAQSISEYDKHNRELDKELNLSKIEFEKIEDLHFKLFDIYYMLTLLTYPERKERDSIFLFTSLPIKNDEEMMKEYTGRMKFQSHIFSYQVTLFLNPIKKKAEELLELLKKEYHLE